MSFIRNWAKKKFLTSNTIRYRIEFRVIQSLIHDHCGGSLGEKLLDAGAGSGEMSLKLMRSGYCKSIVGVEPFDSNYRLLETNYQGIPHTKTFKAALDRIPLADSEMDAVLSTQVFEHIEDDVTAAKEVSRVLRTGGYAVISTPHPPEIFPNDGHVRPGYTEQEMESLFAPQGLELVATEYFFTLPTLRRLMAATELGKPGRFFTISWADREAGLSSAEKKKLQPYGIACLFRKL